MAKSKRKYDVVTVGSAVLDVFMKSSAFKLAPSKEFEGGLAICEAYEGKMEADEIDIASGGGGTNNAVSFARKGLKAAVISEIGRDMAGRVVTAELVKEGVDTKFMVVEEGEETAISVILVSGEGGRAIVTYRGASRMLTYKDIPWDKLKTRWLYISSLGGRITLLEELSSWAGKNNVKVAVNPGRGELSQRERLLSCVKKAQVLIMNQEEAKMLTGIDYTDMRVFGSDHCIVGPEVSVITAGAKGGRVCAEGKCQFYKGSEVKRVSSAGAGDAFGSGLVAGLILGKPVDEAISWGRKNAESVIGYLSAKKGLLYRRELESPEK